MRLVLDTNVVVSGLLWDGPPRRLLDLAVRGDIALFSSTVLLDELAGVLRNPRPHLSTTATTRPSYGARSVSGNRCASRLRARGAGDQNTAGMVEEHLRSPPDIRPDADIHLDVEGQVTLASLTRLVESWREFLGEIGKCVTGSPAKDAVRYVITEASGGSFALGVRPQPARDSVPASMMPRIARTVTSGIRELNEEAKRPRHFSDNALVKLRDLARLVGPETPSLRVSNGR